MSTMDKAVNLGKNEVTVIYIGEFFESSGLLKNKSPYLSVLEFFSKLIFELDFLFILNLIFAGYTQ